MTFSYFEVFIIRTYAGLGVCPHTDICKGYESILRDVKYFWNLNNLYRKLKKKKSMLNTDTPYSLGLISPVEQQRAAKILPEAPKAK